MANHNEIRKAAEVPVRRLERSVYNLFKIRVLAISLTGY